MSIKNWLKKKLAAVALATASVEQNILGQNGNQDVSGTNQIQRHRQGTLADSLKQGVLTQEVKDLRWRMYKILDESNSIKTKIIGYDEDGMPIIETMVVDSSTKLSKIKMDDYDDYELEMVVNNDDVTASYVESIDGILNNLCDSIPEYATIDNDESTTTTGIVSLADIEKVESTNKVEKVISCTREYMTRFKIENFTKKVNIRTISETEKLLEFYISKYTNVDTKNSGPFINEVKKAIKNPRVTDFLEIKNLEFISYKTIGVKDLLEFEYEISKFDKIIEYDGYYVIKFISKVIKNGESIVEQYRQTDLDEKYKNNESK